MKRYLIALALSVGMIGIAMGEDTPFVSYSDALATCSVEWKQSDTRRNTPKGKGVAAWNEFRRACVVEKGYVKGRKAPTATSAKEG